MFSHRTYLRIFSSAVSLIAASVTFGGQLPDQDLNHAYQRALRSFQRDGIQTTSTSSQGLGIQFDQAGSLGLSTKQDNFKVTTLAYGSGNVRGPLQSAKLSFTNKAEGWPQFNITRPGLSEWYVNEPAGLHHWMQVASRPASNNGKLWVKLGISGNPTLKSLSPTSVQVQSGRSILTYRDLKVWDSLGKVLPARLEVSGSAISVVVSDQDAVYPVTIDPLWTQEQKITSPDGAAGDKFATSVALGGEWTLIGAPGTSTNKGSAYFFTRRTGGTWTFEQKLTASDGVASDKFGTAVAIHNGSAIIGAPGKATNTGAAYVFKMGSNFVWSQEAKITANDGAVSDEFGISVAIHSDRAIVGARGNNGARGAAYAFSRSGVTWTQEAKLLATDPTTNDYFGSCVTLYGDRALVGCLFNSSSKGAVYAFSRNVGGTWSTNQKLTASDGASGNEFGNSVSVSGNLAVFGAVGRTQRRGAAYVFTFTSGNWVQTQKLVASDGLNGDQFSQSLSISGDRLIIGANQNSSTAGAAYTFVKAIDNTWSQEQKLVAADASIGSKFGSSVLLTSEFTIIGATGASSGIGAAYASGLPSTKTLSVSYPNLISYSGIPGLYGGITGSGTVTLSAPAPLGGTLVTLNCTNPDVSVPTSFTIPAGSTTGTFSFTTLRVTVDAMVAISASTADFSSSSTSFRLQTNKVTKIVFEKASIFDLENSVCRIDLAVPALSDFVVTLTNGNAAALTAPATVTIPSGQRTINVTVTGKAVASDTLVSLTATPSNSTKTGTITVKPGPTVGSVTFQNPSILFGQSTTGSVTLLSPAPPGGVTVTLASDNLAVTVPATVFIAAGQTTGTFTVQSVGVSATTAQITATLAGIATSGTVTILRPYLNSITLDKTTVRGGAENALLTVNLAAPAPAGGVEIVLLSSKPGVASMPASVTVPEGQSSASVTVTTNSVSGSLVVNLSGRYLNDNAKGAKLTVHNAILASITLDKSMVVGGTENATLTATLTLPAPAGGVFVNLKSTKTNVASVPATVFIPGGATSASVTVTTYPVAAIVDLIGFITGAGTKGAKLTVTN